MTAKAFRVPLSRYHSPEQLLGLVSNWRHAPALFAPIVPELEQLARRVLGPDGEVRVGRVFSSSVSGAEVGIFLERGPRIGAAITCRWKPGTDFCSVSVGPLSRIQAKLQWILLAVGIVVGLLLAKVTIASLVAPQLGFLLGGLAGTGLGVLLIAVATRTGVRGDRASSNQLSQRLTDQVATWVARAA